MIASSISVIGIFLLLLGRVFFTSTHIILRFLRLSRTAFNTIKLGFSRSSFIDKQTDQEVFRYIF